MATDQRTEPTTIRLPRTITSHDFWKQLVSFSTKNFTGLFSFFCVFVESKRIIPNELSSDLSIRLKSGTVLKAHKFVLDARSKNWNSQNLSTINELDLSGKHLSFPLFFYASSISGLSWVFCLHMKMSTRTLRMTWSNGCTQTLLRVRSNPTRTITWKWCDKQIGSVWKSSNWSN